MSTVKVRYVNGGAVDASGKYDSRSIEGKTAIVTGGSSGIGACYVRGLAKVGATVVIADVDRTGGEALAAEFGSIHFSLCDVTKWEDQLSVFRKAKEVSPSGLIDIVVANAGISGPDPVFLDDEDPGTTEEPKQPNLKILTVNLTSYLYTVKLALHNFKRQFSQDRNSTSCLILQTSIAAYLTQPGSPQYMASKFGKRGLLRCLRETSLQHGTRVNSIAPWFIRTGMNDAIADQVMAKGVVFAEVEDTSAALLRIVSDSSIHGRNLAILPRTWAPSGFLDLNEDDFEQGSFLDEMQQIVLRASHRLATYVDK